MKGRIAGLSLILLAGCRNPADNFAKLDVADPALSSGWVQFRHEPGGYAFQAPKSWVIDPQTDALVLVQKTGNDPNLFIRILDMDAAHKNDLVSFAVMRMSFGDESELKVTDLDDLSKKALEGMRRNAPDTKHERLTLPIGPAEHLWGVIEKPMPDGSRVSITSHMVVFATALRPFVIAYGYPTNKESEYRSTLDAMLRTVRLIMPDKGGRVQIPESAHVTASMLPPPTAAPHSNLSLAPPPVNNTPPPTDTGQNYPPNGLPPSSGPGQAEPPPTDPTTGTSAGSTTGGTNPPVDPPPAGASTGETGNTVPPPTGP